MKYITEYSNFLNEEGLDPNKPNIKKIQNILKSKTSKIVGGAGTIVALYLLYKQVYYKLNKERIKPDDKNKKSALVDSKLDLTMILDIYDTKDAEKAIQYMDEARDTILEMSTDGYKFDTDGILYLLSMKMSTAVDDLSLHMKNRESSIIDKIKSLFKIEVAKTGAYYIEKDNSITFLNDKNLKSVFYNDIEYNKFKSEVETILVHEFTHYNQAKAKKLPKEAPKGFSNYVTSKHELEAFTHQAAYDLKKRGYTKEKFINDVKNNVKFDNQWINNWFESFNKDSKIIKVFTDHIVKLLPN